MFKYLIREVVWQGAKFRKYRDGYPLWDDQVYAVDLSNKKVITLSYKDVVFRESMMKYRLLFRKNNILVLNFVAIVRGINGETVLGLNSKKGELIPIGGTLRPSSLKDLNNLEDYVKYKIGEEFRADLQLSPYYVGHCSNQCFLTLLYEADSAISFSSQRNFLNRGEYDQEKIIENGSIESILSQKTILCRLRGSQFHYDIPIDEILYLRRPG